MELRMVCYSGRKFFLNIFNFNLHNYPQFISFFILSDTYSEVLHENHLIVWMMMINRLNTGTKIKLTFAYLLGEHSGL